VKFCAGLSYDPPATCMRKINSFEFKNWVE
jgi:hypothetical protein